MNIDGLIGHQIKEQISHCVMALNRLYTVMFILITSETKLLRKYLSLMWYKLGPVKKIYLTKSGNGLVALLSGLV